MPFGYDCTPASNFTTNATPNTETVFWAMRQVTKGFRFVSLRLTGKMSSQTSLSSFITRWRRWTTAGSGGTALTPSPRREDIPAATTVVATGAPTAGTVSGAYQLAVGASKTGPGGWAARDEDDKIEVPGGTSDEIDGYHSSGEASVTFEADASIEE